MFVNSIVNVGSVKYLFSNLDIKNFFYNKIPLDDHDSNVYYAE